MVNQSWPAVSPESWTVRICGCWSRAASLISRWKRSGQSEAASSGNSTFKATDRSVLEVTGQIDRGHSAATERALEHVAVTKGIGEWGGRYVGHP